MIDLTKYASKDELFDYLYKNKHLLISQKKSEVKKADPIYSAACLFTPDKSLVSQKSISSGELLKSDAIRVKSVINTTNIMDSHSDVHLPGIWTKTLKEQKLFYLIKEHNFDFDHVISDEVIARIEDMEWKGLGFGWEGKTQALIFESIIRRNKQNAGMFERYASGSVKNHSVGMQYIRLELAINSQESEYKTEKEVWDAYVNEIINKGDVEKQGYFWAVTEAKVVEGSAVLRGSNFATPTQSVTEEKDAPPLGTHSGIAPQTDAPDSQRKGLFESIGQKLIIKNQ